jgi:hypothetical protein
MTSKTKTTVSMILGIIIFALAVAGAVLFGGSFSNEEIPCKDGGKCKVEGDVKTGALELIKKCNFKEVGDSCEVDVKVKVTYIEKGKEEPTPIEAKVEVIEAPKPEEIKEISKENIIKLPTEIKKVDLVVTPVPEKTEPVPVEEKK